MSENRLLTHEEITRDCHYEYENEKHDANLTECYTHQAVLRIVKAQDAKTYPLAFEAGRKAQLSEDAKILESLQQEYAQLNEKYNKLGFEALDLKAQAEKDRVERVEATNQLIEKENIYRKRAILLAKKQGARELVEWIENNLAGGTEHYIGISGLKWQAKLKSLEER